MIQNVKKILAPIDFSADSMEAMRGALELAKDVGAEVHIVHVIAPHHSLVERVINAEQARESLMLEEAEEELARIVKDEVGGYKKVVSNALVGPPVQRLCEYATQQEIDLILMATHGRTGAEFITIGSVTEKVARNAPCSVLVFRRRSR